MVLRRCVLVVVLAKSKCKNTLYFLLNSRIFTQKKYDWLLLYIIISFTTIVTIVYYLIERTTLVFTLNHCINCSFICYLKPQKCLQQCCYHAKLKCVAHFWILDLGALRSDNFNIAKWICWPQNHTVVIGVKWIDSVYLLDGRWFQGYVHHHFRISSRKSQLISSSVKISCQLLLPISSMQ